MARRLKAWLVLSGVVVALWLLCLSYRGVVKPDLEDRPGKSAPAARPPREIAGAPPSPITTPQAPEKLPVAPRRLWTLSGRIVHQDSSPAPGTGVRILADAAAPEHLGPLRRTTTDSAGRF